MQFWVRTNESRKPRRHPYVVLLRDNWDDYGYKTTFHATLHLSDDGPVDLGTVKIMHRKQDSGSTRMPVNAFDGLDDNYASVGSELSYYESLYTRGRGVYEPYLRGLRDVAFDDDTKALVENSEAFRVSLLRFRGAERTIEDAAKLMSSHSPRLEREGAGFRVKFKTTLAPTSEPFTITFDFLSRGALPNRVNALIGYNGTGKTKLLSNLAIVASGFGYDTKDDILAESAGRFVGRPRPRFNTVIVISYSAFDTFVIPGSNEEEKRRIAEAGEIFGYVYCGLRVRVEEPRDPEEPVYRLRTPQETEAEFLAALSRIRESNRLDPLLDIMKPLLQDPSFQKIGLTQMFVTLDQGEVLSLFRSLSSGHKVVLKIIVELTAHVAGSEPTLVLLDEPESHLHPPLLAAFLKAFRACLDQFDGFAVIATHSPVVLQETPSRFVRVLRRAYDRNEVAETSLETFAESIGIITQDVFNLEDGSTDWHNTLRHLADEHTFDEIDKMFGRRLGFAARSYLLSRDAESDH